MIDISSISYEIVFMWMPKDLTDGYSTLIQVMAWYTRQQAIIWANVDPDLSP